MKGPDAAAGVGAPPLPASAGASGAGPQRTIDATLLAATVFLSAFLLFQVQPIIGKYILPWFGSTPDVRSRSVHRISCSRRRHR